MLARSCREHVKKSQTVGIVLKEVLPTVCVENYVVKARFCNTSW